MSATAGWYPDPGGQAGMFRYWDGRNWSASLSPTPQAAPPGAGWGGPVTAPTPEPQRPLPSTPRYGAQTPGGYAPTPPQKRPWGWILGLVAVLAVIVVVIVLVVRQVGGGGTTAGPGGRASGDVCPAQRTTSPRPQPGDGRVHGGRLSYPQLGSPWSAPVPEYRVAFGDSVLIQSVVVEKATTTQWLAAVLVGDLVAGDGFYAPKDGAAIVVKCVSGTFYGGSAVTRDDKRNQAMKVDGHDGWVIESQLGFDVPGVQAKSELLIVVIVDTGGGTAGLFYASIPENAPELVQPARDALKALRVSS